MHADHARQVASGCQALSGVPEESPASQGCFDSPHPLPQAPILPGPLAPRDSSPTWAGSSSSFTKSSRPLRSAPEPPSPALMCVNNTQHDPLPSPVGEGGGVSAHPHFQAQWPLSSSSDPPRPSSLHPTQTQVQVHLPNPRVLTHRPHKCTHMYAHTLSPQIPSSPPPP